MKICSKCKINKNLTKFYKDKYTKDKHTSVCKICQKKYNKTYIANNSEKMKDARKEYYLKNKEHNAIKCKKWREEYPEYCIEYNKKYRKENLKYFAEDQRKRRINDENVKLSGRLRSRIRRVLKQSGTYKNNTTLELFGCSLDELKKHIELQFTENMSWKELFKGEIHIDHILPCASFNLTDPEQQKACFHYSNLQPLWAKDNLSKGAKVVSL